MVRAAYTLHAEDDDFGQANTLVNQVMDDAARDRLVETVSGLLAVSVGTRSASEPSPTGAASTRPSGDRIEAVALEKRR